MAGRAAHGHRACTHAGPGDGLRRSLELCYARFDYAALRDRDPIRFVELFRGRDAREVEVAGFLASALAYGNVKAILKSVGEVFGRMGQSPLAYVLQFDPARHMGDWRTFRHRFTDGRDVAFLVHALGTVLRQHGCLGTLVGAHCPPDEPDVARGLEALVDGLLRSDARAVFGGRDREPPASALFLAPRPSFGSACKRLLLFARWMVRRPDRPDRIDFGTWDQIRPSQLILPLDTHTAQLARDLGLAGDRRTVDLALARAVTARLKVFDPEDPVKYDFALAHLGISRRCLHRRSHRTCATCVLESECQANRSQAHPELFSLSGDGLWILIPEGDPNFRTPRS